jgi:UDP-N-acetylmuramoyl-L-alanyl-D-glutamate--2,6-diaminopimelate ligase
VVIVTADNPRGEDVQQICADITAGYPLELHNSNDHHDRYFNHMQDMWHSRHTREWNEMVKVLNDQNYIRRYVIEERFYAIRVAIAMADQFDCVVIAGKGHEDYVEWHVQNSTETKFWFDDRKEARDCLTRIEEMQKAGVDTRNLPWSEMNQKS